MAFNFAGTESTLSTAGQTRVAETSFEIVLSCGRANHLDVFFLDGNP